MCKGKKGDYMEQPTDTNSTNNKSNEIKQTFLSSAISDISTYIQLSDTKTSIILGATVALVVGFFACYDPIFSAFSNVKPCSFLGVSIIIISLLNLLSLIAVFLFGILTISSHVSIIGYKSKWFLPQTCKEYSFDAFRQDVEAMTDVDVIENMAAELYKLNDINRQKAKTMKWTIRSFSLSLATTLIIIFLLTINTL